MQLETANCDNL